MSLIQLIVLVVIAAVVGIIGQSLAGYHRGGFLLAAVIGFIGALLGTWIAAQLRLPEPIILNLGGTSFPILWAIIGSFILALVVGAISRPTRRYYRRRRYL